MVHWSFGEQLLSRKASQFVLTHPEFPAWTPKSKSSVKIAPQAMITFLADRLEAGLVLTGTEVKAARDGKIQLKEAFGEIERSEA